MTRVFEGVVAMFCACGKRAHAGRLHRTTETSSLSWSGYRRERPLIQRPWLVLQEKRVRGVERKGFFQPATHAGETNLFFFNEFDELTKAYCLDELFATKTRVFKEFLFCCLVEAW